MAQFEFIAWLAKWLFQQIDFEFDWDHGNSAKNVQKHGDLHSSDEFGRKEKNMARYVKTLQADWDAVKKGLKKVRAQIGEPKKSPHPSPWTQDWSPI